MMSRLFGDFLPTAAASTASVPCSTQEADPADKKAKWGSQSEAMTRFLLNQNIDGPRKVLNDGEVDPSKGVGDAVNKNRLLFADMAKRVDEMYFNSGGKDIPAYTRFVARFEQAKDELGRAYSQSLGRVDDAVFEVAVRDAMDFARSQSSCVMSSK
jgi:hypothetical protein